MSYGCPEKIGSCSEACPGPLEVEWKAEGLHVSDVEMCYGQYLTIRTLPGIHVERVNGGTVVIETNGLSLDYQRPATSI